jgi:histidine triad (HIT) family protein
MQDCIFCKIVKKEIAAEVIFEDEQVLVFKDIKPVAPTHLLLIPKKHVPTLFDLDESDSGLIGHIHQVAIKVAQEMGLSNSGLRLVSNCGRDAGQMVYHLHYHLIAGRPLQWPPG